MELLALVVVAVSFMAVVLAWLGPRKGTGKAKKLPPGPYQFPIVGNLFQIGERPHHSFAELAKEHGPLMSIRLGSVLNAVVTSPQLSKDVLTLPGFNGRHAGQAVHVHDVPKMSMSFLPVASDKWKFMRKISREQIFANHSLDSSQVVRHENLQHLIDYIGKCCDGGRPVNIREAAFTITVNLMSATLFSTRVADFESESTGQFKEILEGVSDVVGEPNFADFFPILERFDPQTVKRRSGKLIQRLLRLMKAQVDQRVEFRRANPNAPKKNDFLETLLDISLGDEEQMTFQEIEHALFELYLGGTVSSASTIEWVMTELLRQKDIVLSKATSEVRKVLGGKKLIQDSDITTRLPYLQAVINETFRLHPPAPLLFPRSAEEDMELGGYLIPKDTRMILNVWAMGRDPSVWANAESFEPDRFLDANIDYKGLHFNLIPFGSGKRICPGLPLAHRVIHEATAALIGNFDWEFAAGEKHRNHEHFTGLTLRRQAPLKAIPLKPN
ncbi:hypothetical protein C2S53_006098 [Perilla frutescens var. hirtella]|uniref:Cytochrome P450 n=1 Tax=Perilla frutescens var. hirtella TaxID=608512 RepID=A0AAD4JL68_PERFH|nr:hypothetical protein C2S53_006098 [Perilla frutescens var. hirtella]